MMINIVILVRNNSDHILILVIKRLVCYLFSCVLCTLDCWTVFGALDIEDNMYSFFMLRVGITSKFEVTLKLFFFVK